MGKIHPTLNIYNGLAKNYDRMYKIMDRILPEGRNIFSHLKGDILEIGVGTGINLSYYNPSSKVIAVDWSPKMVTIALNKVKKNGLRNIKEIRIVDVQKLSEYFPKNSFDFITSTCVFCSVPNPIKGLREISKVLKPNGSLVQIEHGISTNKYLNRIMTILDPITSAKNGFHLIRNHEFNLKKAGFIITRRRSLSFAGIFRIIISKLKSKNR